MNRRNVVDAIHEAHRFIKQAEHLLEQHQSQFLFLNGKPKESAAVRRASMDLTRALAEMRKP